MASTSDSSGIVHGLEVLADGTLVYPIDVPGNTGPGTFLNGVNNAGAIWGVYGPTLGFTLSGGVYTTLPSGCIDRAINDRGDIEGFCNGQAFLQTNGDPPVPINLSGSGMNNLDQIVGQEDIGGVYEGFVESSDGTSVAVVYPGAVLTSLSTINDQGVFVGFFEDTLGAAQAFYGNVGDLIPFSIPGESGVTLNGINDSDQVVGSYVDATGVTHGFISSVALPEPSSMFLCIFGVSLLVVLKHRVMSSGHN